MVGKNLFLSAKKIVHRYLKDIGKCHQLHIGNKTNLSLKLGKSRSIHIHSVYLKLSQQFFLLHTLLLSDKLHTVAYQISVSQFLLT